MPASARSVLRFDDGGWAEAVGGHVVLDLVNTVAWRLDPDRCVDRLPDDAAVARWARFVGLRHEQSAEAGDEVARELHGLREQLHRVLQPLAVGEKPAAAEVEGLRLLLVDAHGRARLDAEMPLRWTAPGRALADLPVELALAAEGLLRDEDPARLRQCRDDACGWLFLDRSKNASRVWCSSADCGNRMRARRHHQRRTAS